MEDKYWPDITEIKDAIPKECFQADMKQSWYYVIKDILQILTFFALWRTFESSLFYLFPIYWVVQGTLIWCLYVVGHDAGHESFSNNTTVNHIAGLICHSLCVVPFYPWKLSHHWHHRNTCNIDKEEIFYPYRRPEGNVETAAFIPYFGLGIGWIVYLLMGFEKKKPFCHWNPLDSRFQGDQAKCALSVFCCLLVGFGLYQYALVDGYWRLAAYYGIPWMIYASWLVCVTFLHHMDTDVTWYSNDKWSFVKGALSSVDRDYGMLHDFIHNIGTHQIHHLFIKIPHYKLETATVHFRAKFPHLVKVNHDPILPSLHKMFYIYVSQYIIGEKTSLHSYTDPKKAK